MSIKKRLFGRTDGGEEVYAYDIDTGKIKVTLSEFGACIMDIFTPDRYGNIANIVCGYDSLSSYEHADGYQGAVVGRCANRIDRGHFVLDGKEYNLYCNNGVNHLHGGRVGFSHRVWRSEILDGERGVRFSYTSPDGEENYPGELQVVVEYIVTDNKTELSYYARCDKNTVVNLTNHSYFNLGGFDSGDIFDHVMCAHADRYLPINENLIPTGEIRSVKGTPFDFTRAKTMGRDFDLSQYDLRVAGGYDHCLVLEDTDFSKPQISVYEGKTGRTMSVYTTQACVQFYSGNFLNDEKFPFRGGYPQRPQNAFCLETQAMPDSINHANFTSVVLRAGEEYITRTVFEFGIR